MDLFEKYYNSSLRFLSYRPRSEKEVREYLLKKKAQDSIITQILTKLKEQKFLNDEEFVKWWIEQRTRVKPTGLRIIKLELQQKGILREQIESEISNYELEKGELELAKDLVQRRMPRYKGLSKQEIYQKLGSYLARRGFGWDAIKKNIDEVFRKGV